MTPTTVTENYEEIRAYRQKTGTCPGCGKRVVRKFTTTQTVNPFNKNPDGTVRTKAEVRAAVNAQADAHVPDFEHWTCRDKRLAARDGERR